MGLSSLAQLAIDAAGGLHRWRQFEAVSARLSNGGVLWPLKRQQGVLDDVRVRVDLQKEWASHWPFGAPDLKVVPKIIRPCESTTSVSGPYNMKASVASASSWEVDLVLRRRWPNSIKSSYLRKRF